MNKHESRVRVAELVSRYASKFPDCDIHHYYLSCDMGAVLAWLDIALDDKTSPGKYGRACSDYWIAEALNEFETMKEYGSLGHPSELWKMAVACVFGENAPEVTKCIR